MTGVAELPGGLWLDAKLERRACFKPVTGELELTLCELAQTRHSDYPGNVTALLSAALDRLGDTPAEPVHIAQLCVGDRHFLLKELSLLLDARPQWVTAGCGECGEAMDLCFSYAELPVKPADGDYPQRDIRVGRRSFRVRCVTGADQSAVAAVDNDEEAMAMLLERIVSRAGKPVAAESLDAKARALIEEAVEAMSPEVGDELLADCPHCKTANRVRVDLFQRSRNSVLGLLGEVHSIAINYHWPESEIMKLSRERRQVYLGMIDRSRGMVSARQEATLP
jgi:hypothetical protein